MIRYVTAYNMLSYDLTLYLVFVLLEMINISYKHSSLYTIKVNIYIIFEEFKNLGYSKLRSSHTFDKKVEIHKL